MVKKSKLFAALDVHKGRDYKLEKQKKLQKQAAKKKKVRPQSQATEAEVENEEETPVNGTNGTNGTSREPEDDSEGWESDESEDALSQTVGQTYALEHLDGMKRRQLTGGVALGECSWNK